MRVIAGTAKGVPLTAPRGGTRPTTDRVREAVFSVLADWAGTGGASAETQLAGLSVLDLYAGSGAVAFEAASRGAGPVVAVDAAKSALTVMQTNAKNTGLPVLARRGLVEAYLSTTPHRFDVVWLDPPYDLPDANLASVLTRLCDGGWVAENGLVAVERSSRSPQLAWPPRLSQHWIRRYGETVVYFSQIQREVVV
ncbi:MAG: RsmD family RNA methyltransferase [Propionibacteriaceae bacterium]|nr:RsmD family RNA methyltransferase [Propionibacteriaceae bacterium]